MNPVSINSCSDLQSFAKQFSLVHACDVLTSGTLRIATPFHYPNGSQIDLFLEKTDGLFNGYDLSDYGQTADYLMDMHIKPWSTEKRRQLIQDVCEVLDVRQSSGRFLISLQSDLSDFSHAMVRLAQACIRVADLSFTQRLQIMGTFQERVEEFISDAQLRYEPQAVLTGAFGNQVKLDFRVHGQRVASLVQTLSTPSHTNAHAKSLEVFSRWYDLRDHRTNNQFVTVYDTSNDIFREYDLDRLHEVSTVLGFPAESNELQEAIAA